MADEPREDTVKVYPPPIPLRPSTRELLDDHLNDISQLITVKLDAKFAEARAALFALPPPDVTPKSAMRTVKLGAINFTKVGAYALALLGLASSIAKIWKPELVGPIDTLKQLLPGG